MPPTLRRRKEPLRFVCPLYLSGEQRLEVALPIAIQIEARFWSAHDDGNLRNARSGEARLIIENAAEVIAIGKHFILHREKSSTAIDEINTW